MIERRGLGDEHDSLRKIVITFGNVTGVPWSNLTVGNDVCLALRALACVPACVILVFN